MSEVKFVRNNIGTLYVGAFDGLISLQNLILSENKLTSFLNLTDMSRLQTLTLSGIKLFGVLPHDAQVSKTIHLETLNLDNNNIESALAEFFAKFPILKTLSFRQNILSGVPQIYSVAGKLEHLNLGYNSIMTAYSSDFVKPGKYSAFKKLYLSNSKDSKNNLRDSVLLDDDVFTNLDSIDTLSLLNMNLEKLSDLSNNIDTLKTLAIGGNPKLTQLDPKAFFSDSPDYSKSVSLEQISMDENS